MSQAGQEKRQSMYDSFTRNGFEVDIRGVKRKKVYCPFKRGTNQCRPQKECKFSKEGFEVAVQSQVDVAIVMKVMHIAFQQKIDKVILIAGDGDFIDLI